MRLVRFLACEVLNFFFRMTGFFFSADVPLPTIPTACILAVGFLFSFLVTACMLAIAPVRLRLRVPAPICLVFALI
jgi:hypothetical protein